MSKSKTPVKIKELYNNHCHSRCRSFFPTAVCLIHCFHPSRSLCVTFPCVFMVLLICLSHYQSRVLSHMFPSFPPSFIPTVNQSIALTKPALPGVVPWGRRDRGRNCRFWQCSRLLLFFFLLPPAAQLLWLPPSEQRFPPAADRWSRGWSQ